jgi:UDP-perosamine 4-acetyltransferase
MKLDPPPSSDAYVILGAGGHAAVLIDALSCAGAPGARGALCPDAALWGQKILGAPILGDDDLLTELATSGIKAFAVGVGSVGDTRLRRRLFELGLRHGLKPLFIKHPSAVVAASAAHGPGLQILAGAVVGPRTTIGRNVLINTRAVVEHDCHIDDHAHLASGAILCGAARVGECAHVGAGAVVKQGVAIGEGAIIGAGAVVVRDAPAYSVSIGVPAKSVREAT